MLMETGEFFEYRHGESLGAVVAEDEGEGQGNGCQAG